VTDGLIPYSFYVVAGRFGIKIKGNTFGWKIVSVFVSFEIPDVSDIWYYKLTQRKTWEHMEMTSIHFPLYWSDEPYHLWLMWSSLPHLTNASFKWFIHFYSIILTLWGSYWRQWFKISWTAVQLMILPAGKKNYCARSPCLHISLPHKNIPSAETVFCTLFRGLFVTTMY
jgi:hypothetical protein